MRTEVHLYDQCAKMVVRDIAQRYAVLSIHARLDKAKGTVNAPWFGSKGGTMQQRHRDWMKTTVRDLAAYRKSLQSFVSEIPDVTHPVWQNYTSQDGREYEVYYRSDLTKKAAASFADAICDIVFSRKPASAEPMS